MSTKTQAEKRRFFSEYPRDQMFRKTDLAKFENVWEDHPKWVNLGAQKNFAQFATRIGKEWEKSPDSFNELFFKRVVARAIIYRETEKMVSKQPWYDGGYRANIVIYTIATVNECCRRRKMSLDFMNIWKTQSLQPELFKALTAAAEFVNNKIIDTPAGISNIGEWCKKDACWSRIESVINEFTLSLPFDFEKCLVTAEIAASDLKSARKTQKIDNGIKAQEIVISTPVAVWSKLIQIGIQRNIFTPKEMSILKIAQKIPAKLPSEKQCLVLIGVLEKAKQEGVISL